MKLITQILAGGLLVWLGALALVFAVQTIRGRLALGGLLAHGAGGPPTPERMLGLVTTLAVAVIYIHSALQINLTVAHPILPELPDQLLNILLGTNGIFLAGKIARSA